MTTGTSTSVLESLRAAIETAYFGEFDRLGSAIWEAHLNTLLTDDQATELATALAARRTANRPPPTVGDATAIGAKLMLRRYPKQRSPDRARSIGRRRLLAASGALPPALAANYTTSELAVLKIVANEVAVKGYCDLDVPQIAARAGTCETTARNAMRFAQSDGLIKIMRRPRSGLKNLTNIVTIIRDEWKVWIRKRPVCRPSSGNAAPLIPTKPIGCKNAEPTSRNLNQEAIRDRTGVWRPKGKTPDGEDNTVNKENWAGASRA